MSSKSNKQPPVYLFVIASAIAVFLGAQAFLNFSAKAPATQRPDIPGLLWPNPKPLTPFELSDQRGESFNLDTLKGKWTFLFFGYSHCPDVCPIALSVMDQVAKTLASDPTNGKALQFAFVSVDPERDTPEHLAEYVAYFNPDFIGATGAEPQLAPLTRQLGILYLHNKPDVEGNYLVDHTASILLIDPQGRFISVFSAPHNAQDIAERFGKIRAFIEG